MSNEPIKRFEINNVVLSFLAVAFVLLFLLTQIVNSSVNLSQEPSLFFISSLIIICFLVLIGCLIDLIVVSGLPKFWDGLGFFLMMVVIFYALLCVADIILEFYWILVFELVKYLKMM